MPSASCTSPFEGCRTKATARSLRLGSTCPPLACNLQEKVSLTCKLRPVEHPCQAECFSIGGRPVDADGPRRPGDTSNELASGTSLKRLTQASSGIVGMRGRGVFLFTGWLEWVVLARAISQGATVFTPPVIVL